MPQKSRYREKGRVAGTKKKHNVPDSYRRIMWKADAFECPYGAHRIIVEGRDGNEPEISPMDTYSACEVGY